MCEEEEAAVAAWRSHELAGGFKGTGGVWTRLLGTLHQHRHRLNTMTDLVLLWDVSSHRESSQELLTASSGARS